jgi:hypothetical protein
VEDPNEALMREGIDDTHEILLAEVMQRLSKTFVGMTYGTKRHRFCLKKGCIQWRLQPLLAISACKCCDATRI